MGIRVRLGRLSVVCVLVAWLEVCQIVRGCLRSVGWIHLPSRLILHQENGGIGQCRYVWRSGYGKSAQDLSEGQRVRCLMVYFNKEEPSCRSFYPVFIYSLTMHIMFDDENNVWRRIQRLMMHIKFYDRLDPGAWDRSSGRGMATSWLG